VTVCLGIPGMVTEIKEGEGLLMGTVDFGGVRREVCLAYVADEVRPGDYVIVHVGFAISRLDREEAERTLRLLQELELDGDRNSELGAQGNRGWEKERDGSGGEAP
jgi:hydrogenase expression/formation protein HypC